MALRRLPSGLDEPEAVEEQVFGADVEGITIAIEGVLIHTSFEGEMMGDSQFKCQVTSPCTGGDVKNKLREACNIEKRDHEFVDVGFEIGSPAKPLVKKGGVCVKSSEKGMQIVYEYFQGCCGNIAVIEHVQQDEKTLMITVVVTTRAKPAAMPGGTKIYAALSVSTEDIRNDFTNAQTWRVEVLRVNGANQQFQLSSFKAGKAFRGDPEAGTPALKGAGDTVLEAISAGSVLKTGTCAVNADGVTLDGARMKGGKLIDCLLQSQEGSESLVEWEEAHYPRGPEGPQRWTKVWSYLGEEGAATSASQPWLAYKNASPYSEAVCVRQSEGGLFKSEPGWTGAAPETLA